MAADVPLPTRFRFGASGEDYMVGTELARYLNKPANTLYKQYPSMYRRQATLPERMMLDAANLAHTLQVTLVRAKEAERIVEGNDAELKVAPEPQTTETPIGIAVQQNDKESGSDPGPATGLVLESPEQFMQGPMYKRHRVKMPSNPIAEEFRGVGEWDAKTVAQRAEEELLVPITLDLEENGYRVRENFVWNYNEPKITVEQFAQMLCDDLEVPKSMAVPVAASIREQLNDFASYQYSWDQHDERRITINLRIHVGNTQLVDQFEWDINSTDTSPEDFAVRLCADMALGGEYVSTVAHSIREQILIYRKNLLETHIGDQLGPVAYPPLRSVKDDSWGPSLEAVSEQDIEQFQKMKDREMRRLRRLRKRTVPGDLGGRHTRGGPY
eukprot:comp17632_c0_seq1/m.17369 comp17632_c0_seq1/g.17369  ORF comp17632_c0_seq1/g.17369 comp17632_c0_seq1/m.17369 type:complete len:385 (-) comp17632_c0_seq1:364-1518(-)